MSRHIITVQDIEEAIDGFSLRLASSSGHDGTKVLEVLVYATAAPTYRIRIDGKHYTSSRLDDAVNIYNKEHDE